MRITPASSAQFRIGSFELDLQAGELRNNGFKTRLQDQPLEVLAMLVDRRGEVVTREDLRLKLWPADTFVDFEHGLNRAINKLREALGDDAAKPRYIETLPRRGYRLIAPVEIVGPTFTLGNGDSAAPSAVAEVPPRHRAEVPVNIHLQLSQTRQKPRAKLRYTLLLAVAGVIVTGTTLTYLVTPRSAPKVLGYTQLTHDGRMKEGMVTDGTRLYFNATFSGQSVICQVSTSGGEVVPLASTLPNATLADISPKGDELLVVTEMRKTGHGALWTLPLVGGSPRRMGEAYAGGFYLAASAAWSPDGKRVAYIGDALYIAESDGTQPRKIPIPGDTAFRLRWSPDGRVLRLNIYEPKNGSAIWDVSPDGTNLHPLLPVGTKPDKNACCGNWTPDGKCFVFTDFSNLWALREERGWLRRTGREPVQLTDGPLLFSNPVPSKDGKKLFAVGELDRGQLVRYDAKTQGVIPYLSGIWAEGVSFSPDGKWVAYVKQPEGDLWRSKIDGSESLRLTFPPTVPSQPKWSPDGKRIAFVSPSPEGALKINLISADGGSLEEPLPEGIQASQASWSSDGESLAFNYCCGPPVDRTGIHLLNLKTRQVSTLPGSEGLMHPRFSPDGRFITAEPLDLNGPVALYDVNARKRSDLAGSELGCNAGSWSRDSRYVYVRTDTERGPVVNRVRISDGKVEQVANLEGLQLVDGTWMGLAPDDSPLFVRDVGSYEIYALDWEAP